MNKVAATNIYKEGSQLRRVFRFMSDGKSHPLGEIRREVNPKALLDWSIGFGKANSKIASALRTIRLDLNFVRMVFDRRTRMYRMSDG